MFDMRRRKFIALLGSAAALPSIDRQLAARAQHIGAAPPRTFHVAAHGNDGGDASEANPWRTIDKLNAHLFAPGSSILIRGGDVFVGNFKGKPPPAVSQYTDGRDLPDMSPGVRDES